ncbi:MAG: hypothetical protein H8E66_01230 [Planctomycetes bacterium]|nr:hypothetical protein [Planctomycetota bacterium]
MSSVETKPAFLERFDSVWSKMRRTQIGQGVCWGLLIVLAGFTALTAADFWFEVARNDRAVGLGVIAIASLALATTWILRAVQRWSRPRAATEIEERFPELGQAVRTSVQFGARSSESLQADGIQPSLVTALADHTHEQAAPLQLDSIVPVGRLRVAAGLAAGVALALIVSIAVNWEWRVAALRALLGEQAYTELTVAPGNLAVVEGESVGLAINIAGRTNRIVVVATRPVGSEGAWVERELTADDAVSSEERLVKYETTFTSIVDPLDYRVTAGPAESELYRIDVRHPLAIESIRADIAPPEYTGVESSTIDEGNLSVIDGSTVSLHITLDRKPKAAMMILTQRGVRLGPGESPKVEEIPLTIDESTLSTTLELRQDQTYTIAAEAADGMQLPENKFRIRVRYDQAPEVWFEEPDEALEVHSIAEVLLRIRARDDFGLSRAGIVFEVNNEEEYTLLEKDYADLAETLAADGQPSQQTRDALQRLLPLELFGLEEKDSVTYYAFAEDTFPAGTHRTETDLRFIDIRPFRRIYRLPDPNAQPGMNNPNQVRVRSLQEIIARQRFNLNRTIRLDRKASLGGEATLVEVDRIATFEDELSKSTHELAEFLDEEEFDGSDLLFQAETVMLTAIDSMNVGKYDISSQQQKDALRLLIEGRDTIENFLRTRANARQRRALQSFDRTQIQKLRRPKRDKEDEEDPEQLVARIRRLADEQDFVYKTLTNMTGGRQQNAQPVETQGNQGQSDNPLAKGGEGGEGEKSEDSDQGSEGDEENMDDGEQGDDPSEMSREDIERRQQDLAVEARDVETILNRIRDLSDLARSRGTDAADATDEVSGALSRGSTDEAVETARQTSSMLRELALNVEGVMASEASEKIGMSRDLAGMIGALERRLAEEADPDGEKPEVQGQGSESPDEEETSDGAGGGESDQDEQERAAGLARRADRLAETGKTMEDILESAIETNSQGDREAVRRVDEVLNEGNVEETVERMPDLGRMLEERRDRDAQVESEDIADRLDVLSRQLDQVYRSIVTPRIEQLMNLESRAVEADQNLKELETNEQISTWHRKALELMEELDKAQAASSSLDELYEAMQSEGWSKMSDGKRWNWKQDENGIYVSPDSYGRAMRTIIEDIQQQMQELILTDLVADDNEATPPKYKHLVERYIEVLSSDVREKQ